MVRLLVFGCIALEAFSMLTSLDLKVLFIHPEVVVHAWPLDVAMEWLWPTQAYRPMSFAAYYLLAGGLKLMALMSAVLPMMRFTSVCMAVTTVLWTLVFLYSRALYQNHLYLLTVLAWWLVLVVPHRYLCVDNYRQLGAPNSFAPRWLRQHLAFLLFMVHGFAAYGKLVSPDWLNGEPMRHWLVELHYTTDWARWLGLANYYQYPHMLAYGGLLFNVFSSLCMLTICMDNKSFLQRGRQQPFGIWFFSASFIVAASLYEMFWVGTPGLMVFATKLTGAYCLLPKRLARFMVRKLLLPWTMIFSVMSGMLFSIGMFPFMLVLLTMACNDTLSYEDLQPQGGKKIKIVLARRVAQLATHGQPEYYRHPYRRLLSLWLLGMVLLVSLYGNWGHLVRELTQSDADPSFTGEDLRYQWHMKLNDRRGYDGETFAQYRTYLMKHPSALTLPELYDNFFPQMPVNLRCERRPLEDHTYPRRLIYRGVPRIDHIIDDFTALSATNDYIPTYSDTADYSSHDVQWLRFATDHIGMERFLQAFNRQLAERIAANETVAAAGLNVTCGTFVMLSVNYRVPQLYYDSRANFGVKGYDGQKHQHLANNNNQLVITPAMNSLKSTRHFRTSGYDYRYYLYALCGFRDTFVPQSTGSPDGMPVPPNDFVACIIRCALRISASNELLV